MSQLAISKLTRYSFLSRSLCITMSIALAMLPGWVVSSSAMAAYHPATAANAQQPPSNQPAQTAASATVLELDKPIERELAGGQSHAYQVILTEGQFLSVMVEQHGIDVVVTLLGPDGKQIVGSDRELGLQGQEAVTQVAEVAGRYRLEVKPKQSEAPAGRYKIQVAELRTATEQDRALQEARKLNADFVRLFGAGKYDEARPLIERALEIHEKALGPEHLDVASSLNNLALLYHYKRDYVRAEPLHHRALTIREKRLGPEHLDVAASLNNLANLYLVKGDYAKAEPLYQRALTIREKRLGPEHLTVADSLNNLALLHRNTGNYDKAEPLYQRVLTIREKRLEAEHPNVADSLYNLALLYYYKGDYVRAEPLHHRALTIREKRLGPEHPTVADSLNNLANLYNVKGDYAKAEPLYQRALTIREKRLEAEHPNVADLLNNLAVIYRAKGDYAKAEPLFQRALTIREKSLGPEHPTVADSLNNLANFYNAKGDYVRAEPLHHRALTIREKRLGPEHPDVVTSLNNLAVLYDDKGDYAKAEPLYQRALTIREKRLEAEHPNVADLLNNLAVIYRAKGDYAKAEPLFQRALTIREKSLGPEHPDVVTSLSNLADLYRTKGDLIQAITSQSRANVIGERNIVLNLAIGSEHQKLVYLASLQRQFNQTISLHVHSMLNDSAARNLAFNIILQRKGRTLDAMTDSINTLRRHANPQDQGLFDQLASTRAQLAALTFREQGTKDLSAYRARVKQLEDDLEKLEAALSARSKEFLPVLTKLVTFEAIQAVIPSGTALVEFALYRPVDAKAGKYGPARQAVYVLFPQGEPRWVDLGEAAAIDQAVDALRQALRDPKRQDVKILARAVDKKVMQPVRALIGNTTHLLISPDGALNLIPFAALVDEQGRYLVERFSFSYLTSGRDLLRLQVAREAHTEPLILADPAFGEPETQTQTKAGASQQRPSPRARTQQGVTTGKDLPDVYFDRLSETATEAQALKSLLPGAVALTGKQATEAALKQATAPRILHIATHGFFLEDRPVAVAGTRGPSDDSGMRGLNASVKIENPLLRSGLALAGANLRQATGDDDGILTAMEAAGLNLWGTKLVVLSACETGVGEVKNGEGVYGLRRALVLAGSETQVMSLWKVDDRVTRELMTAYYTGLKQGQGRGETLRQVQLNLLKSKNRSHPFYWANFIQSGEWANLDGKR